MQETAQVRKLVAFKCSPHWKVIWAGAVIGDQFSTKLCVMLQIPASVQNYLSQEKGRTLRQRKDTDAYFQILNLNVANKIWLYLRLFVCFHKWLSWIRLILMIVNNWPNFLEPRGDSAVLPHRMWNRVWLQLNLFSGRDMFPPSSTRPLIAKDTSSVSN